MLGLTAIATIHYPTPSRFVQTLLIIDIMHIRFVISCETVNQAPSSRKHGPKQLLIALRSRAGEPYFELNGALQLAPSKTLNDETWIASRQ